MTRREAILQWGDIRYMNPATRMLVSRTGPQTQIR